MSWPSGCGAGLLVGVLLGATGAVAGPPVVRRALRATVPVVSPGLRDAVKTVDHLVPPATPKPGRKTDG